MAATIGKETTASNEPAARGDQATAAAVLPGMASRERRLSARWRRRIFVAGALVLALVLLRLTLLRPRSVPVTVFRASHGRAVRQELFGARSPLGEILRLGDERYRVIGVIAPRGVSIGMDLDEVVHIPVSRALKLFNRSGLDRVLIELRSHEAIPSARARVLAILQERHGGEEDVTVLTQDSIISTFGGILSVLTAVLAGIAAISLTVAGIGIMNVMLVSVSERTREIGLWKAVGALPRQITLVFLAEAAMLSLGGGVAGVAASFALERAARAMYPGFPFAPPAWAVSSALALSIAVGLLSGAMPALRAARLDPTAALARR